MVTCSVTSTSVPPSEYFCAGTSPSEDAANFAALSFVGSLAADVPGDTPYCVTIGADTYTVTVEESRNTVISSVGNVLHLLDTMAALRQLAGATEVYTIESLRELHDSAEF